MQIAEKEINGATWKTKELDGETGLSLALDIMQLVAPAMAQGAKGFDKNKGLMDQSIDPSSVINELMKNFSTEKTKQIIKRMLSNTWKMDERENGTVEMMCSEHFKTLFAGKRLTKDLIPVLLFVFQENFGDFSGLASITGR